MSTPLDIVDPHFHWWDAPKGAKGTDGLGVVGHDG